jgi:crossover junction endodeoxyribonuclease RuvC
MQSAGSLRILGVDPGTVRLGFGVLECRGSAAIVLACGVLAEPDTEEAARRLGRMSEQLERVIVDTRPGCIAIESSFYGGNARSLIRLGEARGMVLALAGRHSLPAHDYAPASVKKSVTGNGGSSKEQVARILKALVPGLRDGGSSDRLDATDALAVAWCHFQSQRRSGLHAAIDILRVASRSPSGAVVRRTLNPAESRPRQSPPR